MKAKDWWRPYAILTVSFASLLLSLLVFLALSSRPEKTLRLASGQPGGVYLPMAQSLAELVGRGQESLSVEVLASDGSSANAEALARKEVEVALIQNDAFASDSLRTLVPMDLGALHFIARTDSGVGSLRDIEGKTVGVGLPSSGSHRLVKSLLRHYEVDLAQTALEPLRIEEGCAKLKSGEVEALLLVLSLKSEAVEELVAGGEVRLVGIGQGVGPGSEIEGFRLSYPYVEPYLIPTYAYAMPRGTTAGVPEQPIPTVAVRTVLAAHRDLPDSVARTLTKQVMENRSRLSVSDNTFSFVSSMDATGPLQFPIHDGAMQYFNRNEPGFLVRYAEVIGLLISVLIAVYGLLRAGQKWLNQRQKDRIDAYYLQLNDFLNEMVNPRTEEELLGIEKELQSIRSTALHLLAKERLQSDESFRIFQTVLSEAGAQVRDKLRQVRAE